MYEHRKLVLIRSHVIGMVDNYFRNAWVHIQYILARCQTDYTLPRAGYAIQAHFL